MRGRKLTDVIEKAMEGVKILAMGLKSFLPSSLISRHNKNLMQWLGPWVLKEGKNVFCTCFSIYSMLSVTALSHPTCWTEGQNHCAMPNNDTAEKAK